MTSDAARAGTPSASAQAPTKRAILRAATALFGSKGYDGTGVQEIVTAAGVTKGAFYHHFASKEDLLRQIHDEFIDYYLATIDRILDQDLSARDALAALIEEILATIGEFKAEITIFFQERRFLSEQTFVDIRAKRDEFEAKVVTLLEQGQERGEFRALPSTHLMAVGIIGMCSWAYHWYRPGAEPPREVGRMYADVILNGLCAPSDARRGGRRP